MLTKIRHFLFPPAGASRLQRVLPYAVLGVLTLIVGVVGVTGWEFTNSTAFCGETCHTMPPEYTLYQVSPHARVDCVECHLGRDYLAFRFARKLGDIRHGFLAIFRTYEYPIQADEMRPARETCELCHYPTKFSDDSLREIVQFRSDEESTRYSTYLAMRTGGGTQREGLGRGIHWHVENEVWFVALDELQQEIPYVRTVAADGSEDVYVALDSPYSVEELAGMEQQQMDCISCHNRISHSIHPPARAVDEALFRHQIDENIPYIRSIAVSALSDEYESDEEAEAAIRAIGNYYAEEYPDFYAENEASIQEAIDTLLAIYSDTVYREQLVNWETHPDNIGHLYWPGCFRCHDGQHVDAEQEVIRLECNLCHSIPLVVGTGVIEPMLPLGTGAQPDSHYSTHWIALHREIFDQTCQACHDVSYPGGVNDASFCSNSACHGITWEYANLDAPGLADVLAEEASEAAPVSVVAPVGGGGPTYAGQIAPLLQEYCVACHNSTTATGGLVLETYVDTLVGGQSGEVITLGDGEGSLLVQVIREGHFAQLSDEELQLVIDWINNDAPED